MVQLPNLSQPVPAAAAGAGTESKTAAGGAAAAGRGGGEASRVPPRAVVLSSVLLLLHSFSAQLQQQLQLARDDLAAASRQGFVHGVLLGLRYVCEAVPWGEMSSCQAAVQGLAVHAVQPGHNGGTVGGCAEGNVRGGCSAQAEVSIAAAVKAWVQQLLQLLTEVAAVALPQLEQQEMNVAAGEVGDDEGDDIADDVDGYDDDDNADDAGDDFNDEGGGQIIEDSGETGVPVAAVAAGLAGEQQQQQVAGELAPETQLLITASWTSLKEVCLLVGTLARCIALPGEQGGTQGGSSVANQQQQQQQDEGGTAATDDSSSSTGCGLLSVQHLQDMGELLLQLLLKIKHNGAVEKSQAGFIALCERLLQSPVQQLNQLPKTWLQVRESAGERGDNINTNS